MVSTVGGNVLNGHVDGVGSVARFNGPISVALTTAGDIVVADYVNNVVRKITTSGSVLWFTFTL